MDGTFSIISTAIVLMFILDPFGNVPVILAILKDVDKSRRFKIIVREVFIGLLILFAFLFFGNGFLSLFHLETEAVTIAGGVIFFIIGLRLIFPRDKASAMGNVDGEPFIVPIAMPMIAGPSALATLIVMAKSNEDNMANLSLSLLIAWGITAVILSSAPFLYRVLKQKGLSALERLMGMLLLIMSVQMFLNGVRGFIQSMG